MRFLSRLLLLLLAFTLAACLPVRRGGPRGDDDDTAADDDDSASDDDDATGDDDDDATGDDDDATGDDDDATGDDDDATGDDDDATGDDDDATASSGMQPFVYTGAVQYFAVPAGVTLITVEAWGAQGGDSLAPALGGLGGYATADIPVTPFETLEVWVGGAGASLATGPAPGGWNGGGAIYECCGSGVSGTGGGASDVRRGSTYADRLIVAAGGGGGGWDSRDGWGGAGGGLLGEDGNSNDSAFPAGGGATQTAGGAVGWTTAPGGSYPNTGGSFGEGGECWIDGAGCGGGGGGWYGGGAGGFAGAGGGSSYVDAPGNSNGSTLVGVRSGAGEVVIGW